MKHTIHSGARPKEHTSRGTEMQDDGEKDGAVHLRMAKANDARSAVELAPMTRERMHAYYRRFVPDADLFMDLSRFRPFVYDPAWVDAFSTPARRERTACFSRCCCTVR